jgi:uncharacterized protein
MFPLPRTRIAHFYDVALALTLATSVFAQDFGAQVAFEQDGVRLVGELWLPDSPGNHVVAVVVPGSEASSAIEAYRWLMPLLDHGIGILVFDKRGTGGSGGSYTQSHRVLARDAVAAVAAARHMDGVDPTSVGLLAFSQGGWVAPIAAVQDSRIRFLVIDSGPAVSPSEEDIWSTLAPMRRSGASEAQITVATALIQSVHRIIESRFSDGWGDYQLRAIQLREQEWLADVAASDSNTGFFLSHSQDEILAVAEQMGLRERVPDFSLFYDPVPTIVEVDARMLWLFGGRDASMPSALSMERISDLDAGSADSPIQVRSFTTLGHGVLPALLRDPASADVVRRIVGFMDPAAIP